MSALSSALDNMQILQKGENDSIEYGWSNNVQDLIIQFQFQLVRNNSNMDELKIQYKKLLFKIFIENNRENDRENNREDTIENSIDLDLAKILYKMIGYTRDIIAGKGEYKLAYMLISELIEFGKEFGEYQDKFLDMSNEMIKSFVILNDEHPYGSWKDLKYFCNYYKENNCKECNNYRLLKNDVTINYIANLVCEQLKKDIKKDINNDNNDNKSLLAKWIPREKSHKFGWLTPLIAEKYYSEWFNKDMPDSQYKAALRKALTHFRQMVAGLNKDLKTPQINQCNNQCNNQWGEINFEKNVTSITMRRQSKAFNMVDKRGQIRYINSESYNDRLTCKLNYKKYLDDCRNGTKKVKGSRVSIADYVKDAVNLLNYSYNYSNKDEIDLLNMQWNQNNKSNNKSLTKIIAMIDTSSSMEDNNCVPLYSAIGLGIRIAENSKLGKRLLTFNAEPEWINLENLNFLEMVDKIKLAGWGMNTNFEAAFNKILNVALVNDISPFEMQDFVLLVCSDMQIDSCELDKSSSMFERMKNKYEGVGLSSKYNTPYTLPHIIFWNLRSTNGFPSLTTTKNVSMLSGHSPALLNSFNQKGSSLLKDLNSWQMLINQLNNKRYTHLEDTLENIWLH